MPTFTIEAKVNNDWAQTYVEKKEQTINFDSQSIDKSIFSEVRQNGNSVGELTAATSGAVTVLLF